MNVDFSAGVNEIPFPVVIINKHTLIEAHNDDFAVLSGRRSSLIGRKIGVLFYEWKEITDNQAIANLNEKWYLVQQKKIVTDNEEKRMYLLLDGTNYYQLQKEVKNLDKLNRELDAIIENSYDGIYITDRHGMTLKTNSAIERISGIPKQYYIGKNVRSLVERGILKESTTFKVLKQGKRVTILQRNFAGKETMMTGNPVINDQGEIEKIVTNIRDLSELNELHEQLKKVQALNNQYKKEIEMLRTRAREDPDVILKSDKMKEIFDVADRIANVDTTVLMLGQTGVGKDVLTRHIYRMSNRSEQGELIKVNCGAIPKDLLESELFGYEAGAFTGANRSGKTGMFEMADKGILFLDEVGELPLSLQVKLLRVLQEKEIQRVGATRSKMVNVRVIAATNRDLKEMVRYGSFREDLYYRLHVLPFYIPPLKERKSDILPLVHYFVGESNQKYQLSKQFDRGLREFLFHYDWPGNVRELANLVERLILTIPADVITLKDLPKEYREKSSMTADYEEMMPLKEAAELAERKILTRAVDKYSTTYEIAEKLATSQATVVRKLKKYNIKPDAELYQLNRK